MESEENPDTTDTKDNLETYFFIACGTFGFVNIALLVIAFVLIFYTRHLSQQLGEVRDEVEQIQKAPKQDFGNQGAPSVINNPPPKQEEFDENALQKAPSPFRPAMQQPPALRRYSSSDQPWMNKPSQQQKQPPPPAQRQYSNYDQPWMNKPSQQQQQPPQRQYPNEQPWMNKPTQHQPQETRLPRVAPMRGNGMMNDFDAGKNPQYAEDDWRQPKNPPPMRPQNGGGAPNPSGGLSNSFMNRMNNPQLGNYNKNMDRMNY